MRTWTCRCGNRLFIDNLLCLSCHREVGWCPSCRGMVSLEPLPEGGYRCGNERCGAPLLKCRNSTGHEVCNRLVAMGAQGEADAFCDCCRHNVTIPDLSVPGHRQRWAELEAAKRRLFYGLARLGLPYGIGGDDIALPLGFRFMTDELPDAGGWRCTGDSDRIYTGHAGGLITINLKEADEVERERLRVDLNESHRTLIGHFRHEIGHYYWELLVKGRCEAECRAVFGDHEALPYGEALERYYRQGPPPDWPQRHVSAYASLHPWEDFAETFALYLDMNAVLDTADHFGLDRGEHDGSLSVMLAAYHQVGLAINELNREMGLLDLVPAVVSPVVANKLAFIHDLVGSHR